MLIDNKHSTIYSGEDGYMNANLSEHKKMHYALDNVGLRAQATAAGLVQLCKELQSANILSEEAASRIKASIANEICVSQHRTVSTSQYRADICRRLDQIFTGSAPIGPASSLPMMDRSS